MIYFIKLINFISKENLMKKLLLISIAAAVAFGSENLLVGAGGGYKKPVTRKSQKRGRADRGRVCKFGPDNHPSKRGQDGCDRGRRGVFEKNGS